MLNQDPENQLVHLRRMAEARGYIIAAEFVDRGVSGARERRPALDEMIARARRGEFQLIGVTALDRLGRNTKHILTLMDQLKHFNVSLISMREGIEMNSPAGQMILTVLSAFAQLERDLISERISHTLAAKKLVAQQTGSGWRCGRPMVIDKEIEQKIIDLGKSGKSIRTIAKELNIGKSSVQRILSDPKRSKN